MTTDLPDDRGSKKKMALSEKEALILQVIRLNARVLGLTFGLLFGMIIFLATNILILKGGANVGPHLQLLSQFFVGYTVTFRGSLIGMAYGAFLGYLSGWTIAFIYNWAVLVRYRKDVLP